MFALDDDTLERRGFLDCATVVYEALIRVDRGETVAAVQLLLTHMLQTTTDDKFRRCRWALARDTAVLSPDQSAASVSRQSDPVTVWT